MNKLIYFSHIPKVAGTTFSSILRRNFGDKYLEATHGFYEGFIPRRNLEMQLLNNFYAAIGGHRISFDVPYDSSNYDVRCVAFVRNPIERLFSEFHYVRKLGFNGIASASLNFGEFISSIARSPKDNWYRNTQARYQVLSHELFLNLVNERKLLLFPVERFDESLIVLRCLIPELHSLRYVAKNVNSNRPVFDLESNYLSEVAGIIDQDLQLYSVAVRNLDSLIEWCGSDVVAKRITLSKTAGLLASSIDASLSRLAKISKRLFG